MNPAARRPRHRSRSVIGALLCGLLVLPLAFATPASAVDTVPPIVTPEQHIPRDEFVRNMKQRVYGVRAPIKAIKAAVGNAPKAAQNAAIRRHIAGSTTKKKIVIPTLTKAESTAMKFGQVTRGAGEAVAKASWSWLALDLSYTGTAAVVEGLGGADSNGLFCDVSRLVNAGSTCHIGPAPSYTPNQEFLQLVPGWDGGRNFYSWGDETGSGTVRFDMESFQYGVGGDYEMTIHIEMCRVRKWGGPGPIGFNRVYPSGGVSTLSHTTFGGLSIDDGECGSWSGVMNVRVPAGTNSTSTAGIRPFWQGRVGPTIPGTEMIYRPVGAPGRDDGAVSANPARWWQVNWTCTTPDGGTTPGLANSAQWHETDPEWPSPPQPSCSSGTLTYARAVQMTNGVESGVLYEWDTPAEVGTEIATEVGQRPECADASCVVELIKLDPVTGVELACFDNPDLCVDWMKDPNKVDNYKCQYGGQAVPLSDCYVYGPIFDHTTVTDTYVPFGDLVTGDPLPRPVPVPPTSPPTIPEDNSCPPPFNWTSLFNPWWYYKGTVCALQETFVPKNTQANVARLSAAWNASSVGQVLGAVGALGGAFVLPVQGSCGVLYSAEIAQFQGMSMTLDTCAKPWPNFAVVRDVAGFAMLAGALLLALRMASRILRVDPVGQSTGGDS